MAGRSKLVGTVVEITLLLAFVGAEIVWVLFDMPLVITAFGEQHTVIFPWLLRSIYFITIGAYSAHTFTNTPKEAGIIGVYRGAVWGILIGVFELIWYHNVNAIVTVFALPWQTMLAGYLAAAAGAYMVRLRSNTN